jgi:hypothetical protein
MAYRAYVGNIPFSYTKTDLENLFRSFGIVRSSDIIVDRETGRSRGFGFVELESAEQLAAAIQGMNGTLVNGRPITVNEARERERGAGPSHGAGSSSHGAGPSSHGAGPSRAPGFGGNGFPPRTPGDRPFQGDRPFHGDRAPQGDRPPRDFDRPAVERSFGDRGAAPGYAPRPGVSPRGPGAAGTPRTGSDRAPAGPGGPAGPAKRERAPDKAADRRHPKMDSYEREHKDWRRYSDDDSWS